MNVNIELKNLIDQKIKEHLESTDYLSKKEKIQTFGHVYITINGLIPENELLKILKHHEISATKKEVKASLKDYFLVDGYYSFINFNDNKTQLGNLYKEIIEVKKMKTYKYLTNLQVLEYMSNYESFINSLEEIVGISQEQRVALYFITSSTISDADDKVRNIKEAYNLNKKQAKELKELLETAEENIRYWVLNGRTIREVSNEETVLELMMNEQPKNDTIEDCLGALNKSGIDAVVEVNQLKTDKTKEIAKNIEESFRERILDYSKEYAQFILDIHKKEYTEEIDYEDILLGHIYPYKKNDTVYMFVPKEIRKIIEENIDSLESELEGQFSLEDLKAKFRDSVDDDHIISSYLEMNGIIERKKLRELLKENDEIDLTLKEIDKIVKKNDYEIMGEYYAVTDFDEDEFERLMSQKAKKGTYRPFSPFITFRENMLNNEIENFLTARGAKMYSNVEEISITIFYLIKTGSFSKEMLSLLLDDNNIKLSKDDNKKLLQLINEHKDNIPVWTLNGYTLKEEENNTVKKVGRNEPCPCGSGKKYKKCCGK